MDPAQLDPVEVVVNTVMVADIAEVLEVDMMSAQEQELELRMDTDWVLRHQCDAGLVIHQCREVDLRYNLLCFP